MSKAISVVHVFYETHMGYQHNGLTKLMKQNTQKSTLGVDEVALFINGSWTACKLLTSTGLLAYYRNPKQELDVETIRFLPTQLGGEKLKWSRNLEANLLKAFAEHQPQGQEAKTA